MSGYSLPPVPRPDHVPEALVVDFDLYDLPGLQDDPQLAMRAFQQSAPDIFWTPRNGGHWVATRAEDIDVMQKDHVRFSHHNVVLPKKPDDAPRELPLEVDPPRHTALRRPLTMALLPKVVSKLEASVRSLTVSLIEGFRDKGACEFVSEFAQILPISVFLDLVELPREDRHHLLPIVENSVRARDPDVRQGAQEAIYRYIGDTVRERRAKPGEDLLSRLINVEVDGGKISEAEAISYATLVLFGGLDTVAGMLAFVARFLALHPEQRRDLAGNVGNEAFLRNAIEELLRRHGLANTVREITADMEYKGVRFRKGEVILPPNMLYGLDERKVDDPLKVDFRRRAPIRHAIFGQGPHTCPGAVLARRELKIFLEEWLPRIPDFAITPGKRVRVESGLVFGVLELHLCWPTS
ncbi:MAG: cytochrome P450 [Sphingomonadaceae bacterium]|nr:cytochrome P450 [Sphingomonadaceae bacterium]